MLMYPANETVAASTPICFW